jgi:hypothetical protein
MCPSVYFQRDGVWEAMRAAVHMALRERMGLEPGPSAAVCKG